MPDILPVQSVLIDIRAIRAAEQNALKIIAKNSPKLQLREMNWHFFVYKNKHLFYNEYMNMNWKSSSHNKYLLQYHLIFVCKYRKKLFVNQQIADDIKRLSVEICEKHRVSIKYMEVDKDHIHYMIETRPNINLSDFVKSMKHSIKK